MDLSKMEEGRATMLAMPKIFDDGCVLQSGQDDRYGVGANHGGALLSRFRNMCE